MKKIILMCAMAIGLSAAPAQAALLTTDFCPSTGAWTCPQGITMARIVFEDISGTADNNDYYVHVGVRGNAAAPAFITAIDFQIEGVKAEVNAQSNKTDDYFDEPTLIAAPGGTTGIWSVSFDKLNNGKECGDDQPNGQSVCAEAIGAGVAHAAVATSTLNIWKFLINLDSGVNPLSTSTGVTLRVEFDNSNGTNAAILSPGVLKDLETTNKPGVPELFDSVPEPASMVLLGLGLLGAGIARRRK